MDSRVICVVGPTAAGKTELAVRLALALDGEVVSCDSMQIYRGMDIGTAKPTEAEMRGVRHHMLNVADPAENYSVNRFVAEADPIVRDILSRGKRAILAGGTGLYLDNLIRGPILPPCPSTGQRQLLEARADREGIEAIYALLQEADPETAARLHLSDRKRIIRAMEVYLETGVPISVHNARSRQIPDRYDPLWLGVTYLDRQRLYDRIDRRVEEMMARGLREEAERLLLSGVPATATAMQAIGYKEILAALSGEQSEEACVREIQQASRRYAKRQLTWFRRNPKIHWLYRDGEEDIFSAALRICTFST